MGSGISLNKLTAEQIGNEVASLGENYLPYREKIIKDGLSGDILNECIQSEKQIQALFLDLEISNNIHKIKIKKDLIDPLLLKIITSNNIINEENLRVSTPRLKINKAKEQDQIISQQLSFDSLNIISDNNNLNNIKLNNNEKKFFNTYDENNYTDYKNKLQKPYIAKTLKIVPNEKVINQCKQIIIPDNNILKLKKSTINMQYEFSISFFPCRKVKLNNVKELPIKINHNNNNNNFTLDDQKQVMLEFIEISNRYSIFIPTDNIMEGSCMKCDRCQYNTNPNIFHNYRINKKNNKNNKIQNNKTSNTSSSYIFDRLSDVVSNVKLSATTTISSEFFINIKVIFL